MFSGCGLGPVSSNDCLCFHAIEDTWRENEVVSASEKTVVTSDWDLKFVRTLQSGTWAVFATGCPYPFTSHHFWIIRHSIPK